VLLCRPLDAARAPAHPRDAERLRLVSLCCWPDNLGQSPLCGTSQRQLCAQRTHQRVRREGGPGPARCGMARNSHDAAAAAGAGAAEEVPQSVRNLLTKARTAWLKNTEVLDLLSNYRRYNFTLNKTTPNLPPGRCQPAAVCAMRSARRRLETVPSVSAV